MKRKLNLATIEIKFKLIDQLAGVARQGPVSNFEVKNIVSAGCAGFTHRARA